MSDIKERIAMLLNLAGNNPSETEAQLALLKARELMAKYKLRPEECKKGESTKVIRETLDITCTAMTNPWAVSLSATIAEHYCCRAYRSHSPRGKIYSIGLVGLEDDFEIAKRIVLYAYECVNAAIKHNITHDPTEERGTYREKCNAYGWGFAMGVSKAFAEQTRQHQEWGLVLVVPKEVDDSMQGMGKKTSFGKIKDNHAEYRAMGYKDGREFDPAHRVAAGPAMAAIGECV